MRFILVYVQGASPRLQFISDAAFSAYCMAGGGISPPMPTTPFENWIWELPDYNSLYDVPMFSPSQLVDAMNWANLNGQRIENVMPLMPQRPHIQFVTSPDEVQNLDDL